MSTFDDRLRAFGRRRYDPPRAGSLALTSAGFVVIGVFFALLPPHRTGPVQAVIGLTGLLVVEGIGWHRRRERRRQEAVGPPVPRQPDPHGTPAPHPLQPTVGER